MRFPAFATTLMVALFAPATALASLSSLDSLLLAAPNPDVVRARLLERAHAPSTRPTEAARAFGFRAMSFAREGMADSAAIDQERAFALDDSHVRRLELATALIARLGPGDAARAREVLRPLQPSQPSLWTMTEVPSQALMGWAHYLAGHADSAEFVLNPIDAWLTVKPEWRYRLACVAMERGEWIRAMDLLIPLAVATRKQDSDVMEMMNRGARSLNSTSRLDPMLSREIALHDAIELELLTELGARRVSFKAPDGFPLAGVLFKPANALRPRAAVVIVAPGDTIEDCDSLAVGLRRLGLAVLFLEPRGTGRSIASTCPSPETWVGREREMQSRVARDVREAVATLAREAGADTSSYLLAGIGPMGSVAVEAATLDRRARTLMLVSPSPSPVDWGSMRASLAALGLPVYFQTAPEDVLVWDTIDAFYRACDPRASRVADSGRQGHWAKLFRYDPRIMARFRLWLSESWPPARRATPRPAPRRG